jgi:tetratricopeptide (TPR) repeat protein
MSSKKKQVRDTLVADKHSHPLNFFFVPGKCTSDDLKVLDESVKKLHRDLHARCAFFIIDTKAGSIGKMITGIQSENGPALSPEIHIIGSEDTDFAIAGDSQSIWLNLEGLSRQINFNEFFRNDLPMPAANEQYLLNWADKDSMENGGWILNSETSSLLLSKPVYAPKPSLSDYEWYLRQNNFIQKFHTVQHNYPYTPVKFPKNLNFNPLPAFRRWFNWNFIESLKKGPEGKLNLFTGEHLNRSLFVVLALLSLVVLPIISFNAGISGDEEKHWNQAAKVYNYFATDGKDTTCLNDEKYKLNYYGQSFDLLTFVVVKTFHIEKIYETRHVLNGLVGAVGIVCGGMLARILFGNIAGIITMLLLFFSPGYLGHAMNNPLDVPFAAGYIFTLLQLVRFLKRLPRISYGIALLMVIGIAFTISIRIGGLVLIPYIFMFSGLYLLFIKMPWKTFSPGWFSFAFKGIAVLAGISILSFFLSLLPWPYGQVHPLKNPFDAYKMMEHISVALRVMFEGKMIWSDNLPAGYIPKSIILSIPLLVIAGFVAALVYLPRNRNLFWVFLLFFTIVFPVSWIIYKQSNVYGAWRHLLFIYPPMVVMAGIGIVSLIRTWENKYLRAGTALILAASMAGPVSHIFRNYPNQYIYFNEIAGGVKKAYKKYETDYYMVSLKQGTDWIKENVLKGLQASDGKPLKIISNAPTEIINYYFRDYKGKISLPYTRYYDRGIQDWDYAIFFCNYIDPYQITHNIWPPKNTIYTVNLDGVKICAVVRRISKDDFTGYEMMNKALKERNAEKLSNSISLMENAIKLDPNNEITYLNLAQAYIMSEQFETARKRLSQLLTIYPNYEKAINLMGYSYLSEGEKYGDNARIERAVSLFNETIKINYKFAGAYHNLGLASMIRGNDEEAYQYFQKSIDINPNAGDSYYMIANLFEKRGDKKKAQQIREYASKL